MTTNKLEPEQIKAFKEKEAEVFKAAEKEFEENGFNDTTYIEWFADEVFAAGDKEWGLEILQKIEGIAKEFYDLIYPMEILLKLNENDRLLALIKKAEPMIKEDDYDVSKDIFRSSYSSGDYLILANILLSIDKNRAVELYKKAEEKANNFMDFIQIARNLIERQPISSGANGHYIDVYEGSNHLADKENALRIVHQKCIPLVDKINPNLTTQAMQQSDMSGKSQNVVKLLIDLDELQGSLWDSVSNINQMVGILADYRKKNNL